MRFPAIDDCFSRSAKICNQLRLIYLVELVCTVQSLIISVIGVSSIIDDWDCVHSEIVRAGAKTIRARENPSPSSYSDATLVEDNSRRIYREE